MRLVIFIQSLHCGGAERVAANLANYWARAGWDVTLVTIDLDDRDFYELDPSIRRIALDLAGGNSELFLAGLRRSLRRAWAFRRVLRKLRPSVALAMMSTTNVVLAYAALGMHGVITIGTEHSYPPRTPLKPAWEFLRSIAYGWLSAVTALTTESAEWLRRHTRASCVPVIPNAAIWPLPVQTPVVRPETLVTADDRALLAVGRLNEEKQLDHLVSAFSRLAEEFPQWRLIILGEGPLRGMLEAQVQECGLQGRVLLLGRVGNVGHWYERADLYAMTSLFEGFPNTLAEALAYGVPAVSYDCDTGPRDLIRPEVDGLLVSPGDFEGFVAALRRLMSDDELRRGYARRAVEVRERYSMKRVAEMWEQLFEKLRG